MSLDTYIIVVVACSFFLTLGLARFFGGFSYAYTASFVTIAVGTGIYVLFTDMEPLIAYLLLMMLAVFANPIGSVVAHFMHWVFVRAFKDDD